MSLSKEKVAQLFVYSSRCGHQRICNPRKHTTCLSFRILYAYTQCIGIANPDEQNASKGIKTEPVRESPWLKLTDK